MRDFLIDSLYLLPIIEKKLKETISMDTAISKKGLNGFQLKYIALVCMVFDHIHYFFPEHTPVVFSMIGRLAAPLFLFCLIEGFVHTKNRKRYILVIYLISVAMGLIRFSFYNVASSLVRHDGFFPENAMLSSFAILLIVLQGIAWCGERKLHVGIPAIMIPVIWPFLLAGLFHATGNSYATGFFLNLLSFSFLPSWLWIADGGMWALITGVVLYLTRRNRLLQAVTFVITSLTLGIIPLFIMAGRLSDAGVASPVQMLLDYYEWMNVFAVIPILLYNGEKGKGNKKLFYCFYPAHIYLLYALSWLFY